MGLTLTTPPRLTSKEATTRACHDQLVVECPEEQAEEVARFVEEEMVAGMDEVLNGPHAEGPCVPVEIETQTARAWAS